jgi:uncharacterized membrane protein
LIILVTFILFFNGISALDENVPGNQYLPPTAWFLACTADALILLCLLQIAFGLLDSLMRERTNQTEFHDQTEGLEVINQVLVVALIILAIVAFPLYLQLIAKSESNDLRSIVNLYSAYNIIYWVVSLEILILSVVILQMSISRKSNLQVRKPRSILFVIFGWLTQKGKSPRLVLL